MFLTSVDLGARVTRRSGWVLTGLCARQFPFRPWGTCKWSSQKAIDLDGAQIWLRVTLLPHALGSGRREQLGG